MVTSTSVRLRLLCRQGEVEILQAQKMRALDAQHGKRPALLLLADETQRAPGFAACGIAAPLSARQGDHGALVAAIEGIPGKGGRDSPVVVRVRPDEHEVHVHQVHAADRAGIAPRTGHDLRRLGSGGRSLRGRGPHQQGGQ